MKTQATYVASDVWSLLEGLFRESKQYRGDNSIRLQDLEKLLGAIAEKGGLREPGTRIDPKGGSFSCQYRFDPKIWGKWFPSQDAALTMAASDKDTVNQYAGRSQGYTSQKANWSGRVINAPGKARSDFERMPSAMDRYDVLMQGEITMRVKRNRKTGELEEVPDGDLFRVAYSPSIGSTEERRARLVSLISGQQAPALARRPQPHVPEPTKADLTRASSTNRPAQPVPRVGQNVRPGADDDNDVDRALADRGGGGSDSFRTKMAKHNAEYQPAPRKPPEEPNDDDALFPKKRK